MLELLQPVHDLDRVEAEQVPPLVIRDPLLEDEPADVAYLDAEHLCDLRDGDQVGDVPGTVAGVGAWESHTVTSVSVGGTRPILVIDDAADRANVFLTHPALTADGSQSIFRRSAPLSTLDFGAAAVGELAISSTAETAINDATSTKQVTTAASGLIVAATNIPTLRYLHACIGAVCPVKRPRNEGPTSDGETASPSNVSR